jgi:hypothetical protein
MTAAAERAAVSWPVSTTGRPDTGARGGYLSVDHVGEENPDLLTLRVGIGAVKW